jgi:hypothetical protein
MFKNIQTEKAVSTNRKISSWQLALGGLIGINIGFLMITGIILAFDKVYFPWSIVFMTSVIFTVSVYMVICGIRRRIFDRQYNRYIEVLNERSAHSIDQLALMLEAPAAVVRKNLEKMIKKKFIVYAFIDDETNTINRRTMQPIPELSSSLNKKTISHTQTSTRQRAMINGKEVSSDDPAVKEIFENVENIMKQVMSNPTNFYHEMNEVSNIASMTSSASQPQTREKQQKVVKCAGCGAKNTIIVGEAKFCKYCGNSLAV